MGRFCIAANSSEHRKKIYFLHHYKGPASLNLVSYGISLIERVVGQRASFNYLVVIHITGANVGVWVQRCKVTLTNSKIYGNRKAGLVTEDGSADARNNWWGDASGPKQEVLNPGGKGQIVRGNVLITPWMTK